MSVVEVVDGDLLDEPEAITAGLFDTPAPEEAALRGKARGTATTSLLEALERHYVKPGTEDLPGGVFVPEVGFNGTGGSRRADAIYIGFTAASSRLMIGHELKATRSDWLRELDQVVKADAWSEQCHEWWIVALPGVVKREEVPAEWGLMEPPSGARGSSDADREAGGAVRGSGTVVGFVSVGVRAVGHVAG